MNRLADQTSPYLRQHRDNPVDWYPWGEEAFARAREVDRPLLVSIGYSACHWCHVMAHESFEDDATAEMINARFVPVKVDREERPDVDAVYMEAVQALSGHGGWPLTVFTTPDGRPFFGGTYFPKRATHAMPAFTAVLGAVGDAWTTRREELVAQAEELTGAVASRLAPPRAAEDGGAGLPPAGELLRQAVARFAEMYDPEHGGIGRAPKFPQAPMLELLLCAEVGGLGGPAGARPLDMVTATLAAMAAGGIYDHLGGGFARYSVDRVWLVPHFEKMLYDQASLARVYLHAFQLTGDARWAQVLDETLGYVLRDLADPGGAIRSSEDADSEGEEGRFYTWTPAELEAVLGPERARLAADWYGVSAGGNFEGRSILHRPGSADLLRPPAVEACRAALFEARSSRVRPGVDDKVLTEWNAMTCSVLAEAGAATGRADWRDAAVRIGEFLLASLRRPDGRWLRSWQAGRAAHLAVAADYAWLVDCFTRLGESTGERRWTAEAVAAADGLVALFSAEDGGWYSTGSDAERLVVRPRDTYDGVTPAAGSVAASALARLGALVGDEALAERARRSVAAAGAALVSSPIAFPHLVGAAVLLDEGPLEIVVAGDRPDLVAAARSRFLPDAVLAWGEPTPSPLWEGRDDDRAYVCRAGTCLAPVGDPAGLLAAIEGARRAGHGPSGVPAAGR
ncbi:MAG TPA: thioredoxin domain-containing protein [Acidimicrobiales bacterium]|nr:thioredoxin domain-containing protein [Acidimicrobiales bacterium]